MVFELRFFMFVYVWVVGIGWNKLLVLIIVVVFFVNFVIEKSILCKFVVVIKCFWLSFSVFIFFFFRLRVILCGMMINIMGLYILRFFGSVLMV